MHLWILFISLIAVSCKSELKQSPPVNNMTDTTFSFVLTDFFDESSKDSHHYSKSFSLKSGILRYDYIYRGFPDNQEEHKELPADDSMITAIKEKINTLDLVTNYDKKFPVNERGFIVRTGKRLTLFQDTVKYSVSVTGGRPMDMKDEMYNKLSQLYYFLDRYFDIKK